MAVKKASDAWRTMMEAEEEAHKAYDALQIAKEKLEKHKAEYLHATIAAAGDSDK